MGQRVTVEPGIQLFVEDIGEGQPVVLIHGWPANNRMFEYQAEAIVEKGYRYVGIDLRGYGQSDRPASGYDYDRKADDVRAVIDHLNLSNVVLGGFSMGGPIALRYMSRHQQHQVEKLLLMAPAAPVFTQREDYQLGMKQSEVDDLIANIRQDRSQAIEGFGQVFFDSNIEVSEAYASYFHGLTMEASLHGTTASAESLRDEDLRGELSAVTVPASSFHGKQDQVCPFEFSHELQKGISHLNIVPFENSGHALFFEDKDAFNEELLKFLGQ